MPHASGRSASLRSAASLILALVGASNCNGIGRPVVEHVPVSVDSAIHDPTLASGSDITLPAVFIQ